MARRISTQQKRNRIAIEQKIKNMIYQEYCNYSKFVFCVIS